MLNYSTICDFCKTQQDGWPNPFNDFTGWPSIQELESSAAAKHICPNCSKQKGLGKG
jgi:hypothetical protein